MARPLLADDAVVDVVHAWHRLEAVLPNAELAMLNDGYVSSLPEQFERIRSALEPSASLTLHPVALEAKPAEIVLTVARAKRADLIVTATHGHGALYRWMLGSTSSALLRGADCSVLLVPEPPRAERQRMEPDATATSTSRTPGEWTDVLQAFVHRNADRRTRLEIDDPSIGAQVQETGYALVGATYDPRDACLALMTFLGEPASTSSNRSASSAIRT
jgi:nucleotide-binding universal stress UspA family protein